ncbi:hypothetical protein BJP36_41150 [Moorena producens JHB]|uniref:Uncharacterized protein n=1 Tax=Moorena producens (strain JHB) TaxID=1454205 RepID=A0A9Q9SSE6_MOOP1|nr:hypothetical protein [Moorena producens]WAN68775.1 hypothetical protein BJP36_41150 [Moorena producens JHB]
MKQPCLYRRAPAPLTTLFRRFPIRDFRFPIPDSRFPIPDSRFFGRSAIA